jgi:hypothetical protein
VPLSAWNNYLESSVYYFFINILKFSSSPNISY